MRAENVIIIGAGGHAKVVADIVLLRGDRITGFLDEIHPAGDFLGYPKLGGVAEYEKFPGCSFPFRYSPGYGDLPLEVQGPLLELLDAPRRAGLCATQTHLLTPRKSVTAILGAADGEIERTKRSCLGCPAQGSCQYRKAGGHCGIS